MVQRSCTTNDALATSSASVPPPTVTVRGTVDGTLPGLASLADMQTPSIPNTSLLAAYKQVFEAALTSTPQPFSTFTDARDIDVAILKAAITVQNWAVPDNVASIQDHFFNCKEIKGVINSFTAVNGQFLYSCSQPSEAHYAMKQVGFLKTPCRKWDEASGIFADSVEFACTNNTFLSLFGMTSAGCKADQGLLRFRYACAEIVPLSTAPSTTVACVATPFSLPAPTSAASNNAANVSHTSKNNGGTDVDGSGGSDMSTPSGSGSGDETPPINVSPPKENTPGITPNHKDFTHDNNSSSNSNNDNGGANDPWMILDPYNAVDGGIHDVTETSDTKKRVVLIVAGYGCDCPFFFLSFFPSIDDIARVRI